MTLQQLKYFRVLAEVQHFTKAAEILLIAQPSLSYSISELEKELNVPLFEKSGKKIMLNQYGKLFLNYVKEALDKLDEGRKELDIFVDPSRGVINLGYIYSLGSSLLAGILENFYKNSSNKGINFNFIQNSTKKIVNDLIEGKIDLVFCAHPLLDNIKSIPLFNQELFLIVYKDHWLANKKEVDLKDICNEPFIFVNKNSAVRSFIDNIFKDINVKPNIVFEAEECNAVTAFVSSKLGISIIPQIPALDESKMSVLKIKTPICQRTIYLSWIENRFMTPSVAKFKDYVVANYVVQPISDKA